MKKHINFFIRNIITAGLVLAAMVSFAQSPEQAKLLEEAYNENSTEILYQFFDRWSEEVKTNEKDAKNKYEVEAYKVFEAFYQPLQPEKVGWYNDSLYRDVPYLIVQSSLWRIYEVELILYKKAEIDSFCMARLSQEMPGDTEGQKEQLERLRRLHCDGPHYSKDSYAPYLNVECTMIDTAVDFRPPVSFEGKKIVYITEEYKKLLDAFLGDEYIDYDMGHQAFAVKDSKDRQIFISQAAKIHYGHWGGYWQYETYPKASSIYFDKDMQRAIVSFRFIYSGGSVILEKQDGVWTIVDAKITWVE